MKPDEEAEDATDWARLKIAVGGTCANCCYALLE